MVFSVEVEDKYGNFIYSSFSKLKPYASMLLHLEEIETKIKVKSNLPFISSFIFLLINMPKFFPS